MNAPAGAIAESGVQVAGLRRFLIGLAIVTATAALAAAVAGFVFSDPLARAAAQAASLVLLAFGAWLSVPWIRLRAGDVRSAALLISAGILAAVLAVGTVLPNTVAALAVAPVIAVAIAMQYLDRRTLAGMIVASVGVSLVMVTLEEFIPVNAPIPGGFDSLLRISTITAVVLLVSLLLWQFSRRLRESMDRAATTNAALVGVQDDLKKANRALRRQISELERRNEQIELLSEMAELLQACETIDEAFAAVSTTGRQLFGETSGALYVLDEARQHLERAAAWGPSPPPEGVFGPGDCWALRRGRFHVVDDPSDEFACTHLGSERRAPSMCIPLTAQSESLGIVTILRGTGDEEAESIGLDAERRQLAVAMSEHLSLWLANYRLRETLRAQATRDPLTGLFNRRYMEDSLERELHRAERDAHPLAVVMIDIDHFKEFNDNHGHDAGDQQLRILGEFLQSHVRGEDIACRYGGEEFTLILPKASLADARRRADLLRIGLRNAQPRAGNQLLDPVTISVGVAAHPDHGSTGEMLIRAADEALYRAKAAGRNRVLVAQAPRATA